MISVITIFLDAERYLAEAIESVRTQTYDNWELLLVDDGSVDASGRIAREFVALDPQRIRYLEHPGRANRGMSVSRNLGIARARADIIAFLDADDVYLPGKLARQLAVLTAHPEAGAIYGPTEYWYGWTGRPEDVSRDRIRRMGVSPGTLVRPPALVTRFLLDEARTPATCGVLLRRVAIERAGGFEASFRGMFEDQVFFYKLFATSPVWIDGVCCDRYRQHGESWCHRMRDLGEWDGSERPTALRRAFLEWLATYVDAQQLADPVLRAELRRQLRPYSHPLAHRVSTLARFFGAGRRHRPDRA